MGSLTGNLADHAGAVKVYFKGKGNFKVCIDAKVQLRAIGPHGGANVRIKDETSGALLLDEHVEPKHRHFNTNKVFVITVTNASSEQLILSYDPQIGIPNDKVPHTSTGNALIQLKLRSVQKVR
jgi:hypothetical protein